MKFDKHLSVIPRIPERIHSLREIAFSFWWSWNPQASELFHKLDEELWGIVGYNPVVFLKHISQKALDQASEDQEYLSLYDSVIEDYQAHRNMDKLWFKSHHPNQTDFQIAYFSAEFGFHESLPIYTGGLGILAGDHVKSASELGFPFIGVGLLYRNGYFQQKLSREGWQENSYPWYNFADFAINPIKNDFGEEMKISVELNNGTLHAKIWKATVMNSTLLLLDTDIPENPKEYRIITEKLYGGDHEMRVRQEILLGIGGVRAIRMAGYQPTVWHMNEGHSVFMALERIRERVEGDALDFTSALEAVRSSTVFTTHTPVPAGNDVFDYSLMEKYFAKYWGKLGVSRKEFLDLGTAYGEERHHAFNLTILAMKVAAWRNGVSELHGTVSRDLWKNAWQQVPTGEIPITHITNGVHVETWLHPKMRSLFDQYLPEWKDHLSDPDFWSRIDEIPDELLWKTTREMKEEMIDFVHERTIQQRERHGETIEELREIENIFDPNALTLGFARRFATYKRATLMFRNMDRLDTILNNPERPVQIIFAGKAHPADRPGQELIKQVYEISRRKEFKNRILFVENYDMHVGRHLVSGVDIWVNTPRRPHEASGTSGQKVPMNGGVNFSVLDGWWVEGYHGNNGWIIGDDREYPDTDIQDNVDSVSFYDTLEKEIIPQYYDLDERGIPTRFIQTMKASMKTVIPAFNTHRMVTDYLNQLYLPADTYARTICGEDLKNAKDLAQWKQKVCTEWPSIKIHSNTKRSEDEEIPADTELEFSATVYLGELDPSEVQVELYFARYNIFDHLEGYETFPMQMEKQTIHHTYIYKGKARLRERGSYAYSMRIIPKHPLLCHPHDLGLVRWIQD